MAITFGSLKHTPSGRKRKPLPKSKKYTRPFVELKQSEPYRRETPQYTSYDGGTHNTTKAETPQLDSTYTIAPAYNKGAYQVISRENIKDIGR